MTPKSKIALFLIVIVALGIFLRLDMLFQLHSYWYDEVAAVEIAKKPFLDSWQYLRVENNPPLYYWTLRVWGLVFGFGEVATRSLSIVIGVATILAFYWLGKRLFGPPTGLVAAFLFSVAPFAVYLNTEARMYSMVFLFSCLSFYFFWRFIRAPEYSRRLLAGYALSTLLLVYTHLTGLALVFIELAYAVFFLRKRDPGRLRKILLAALIVFLVFSPYIVAFVQSKVSAYGKGLLSDGWYFKAVPNAWPDFVSAPVIFLNYFINMDHIFQDPLLIRSLSFLLPLIFLGLVVLGSGKGTDELRSNRGLLLLLFSIFFIPLFLYSVFSNIAAYQYFVPSAVAFYLLAAFGIGRLLALGPSRRMGILMIVSLLSLNAVMAISSLSPAVGVTDQYNEIYGDITKEKVGAVLTEPAVGALILSYYLKQPSPPVFLIDERLGTGSRMNGNFDSLAYSLRHNWNYAFSFDGSSAEKEKIAEEVKAALSPAVKKVAYFFLDSPRDAVILTALRQEGFRLETSLDEEGRDAMTFAIFRRA